MRINNQQQQALYYLVKWDKFTLLDVINDSRFYKFQSRLSELEKKYGTLTKKTKKQFKNKFGRKSRYTVYECINKDLAKSLITDWKDELHLQNIFLNTCNAFVK